MHEYLITPSRLDELERSARRMLRIIAAVRKARKTLKHRSERDALVIGDTVGERIAAARKGRRMLQRDLAMAAGMSPSQLCLIERGCVATQVDTLCRIAAALGVHPGELMPQGGRERKDMRETAEDGEVL